MSVEQLIGSFRKKVLASKADHARRTIAASLAAGQGGVQTVILQDETTQRVSFSTTALDGYIELVALDMDGTLLNEQDAVSSRVHRAVRQASTRGVFVVLATGRPPRSVEHYYRSLGLGTPIISHNGALIWDVHRKRAIRHCAIAADLAHKVIAFARKHCLGVFVSHDLMDTQHCDAGRHPTCEKMIAGPVTRIMFQSPKPMLDELQKGLEEKFAQQLAYFRSDPQLLQIMTAGVSKASALDYVSRQLKIPRDRVMAVGDAGNDIDMIRWAGLGVAMANANATVRRHARHTVPSNKSDGVAVAIEKFVL